MISKEDRAKAVYLMNEVPLGTVVVVEYTDGRLNPVQKYVKNRWLLVGMSTSVTAEDIMEPVNIEKVTVFYEYLRGKD